MNAFLDQFYANGAVLILWGALLFHMVLPIPRTAHPAVLWQKFALLLTNKVNSNTHYQQSIISGGIACSLMMLPAFITLLALKPLVWQPQLFDLALLLLALDWRNTEKFSTRMFALIAKEKKEKARAELAPWVNRNTETLSMLGVGKASAETIIMSYGRGVVSVLFWYAIFGGIGAFLYRLLVELARTWSPSRKEFSPFGVPTIRLLALFDFIPLRLFSLFVIIGQRSGDAWQNLRTQSKSWPLPGPSWLLIITASKLQLSIGGPAIYENKKTIRARIGGRIAPTYLHLAQIQQLIIWRILAWVFFLSAGLFIFNQGL